MTRPPLVDTIAAPLRFRPRCFDSCVRDFLHALRPLKNARKRDMNAVVRLRAYIQLLQQATADAEELHAVALAREAVPPPPQPFRGETAPSPA